MIRLFVGNIPHSADEKTLLDYFTAAGYKVGKVQILRDRITGNSRGFGFVELVADSAETVIEAEHGQRMMGRILTVNVAHPKKPREQYETL